MNAEAKRYERNELTTIGYVIIAITIAIAAGRIAVVKSREGDTAFLSANDRSRWCTIAALVEDGTFVIDRQLEITDPSGRRRPWSTIDRVRHTGTDGVMHFYSSKPPLFTILISVVYWVIYNATNLSLTDHPIYVARMILGIVNLPMLAILLVTIWRIFLGFYMPDSGKIYGLAVACFGTALLPLTTTLNNHLPAAMTTALTLALYLNVAGKNEFKSIASSFLCAGLAAAATVVNELPALAMFAVWTVLFFQRHVIATATVFLPAALLVGSAYVVTNQIAHQSYRPPYMHRSDGDVIATLRTVGDNAPSKEAVAEAMATQKMPKAARRKEYTLVTTSSPDRWIIESNQGNERLALAKYAPSWWSSGETDSSTITWEIREWDHWYDYPGSYWTGKRRGVDAGEPSRLIYALNLLIGTFGIFSLTPVWLLIPKGFQLRTETAQGRFRINLAIGIAVATCFCLLFYIARPQIDRNYGGVSSSFRWMLWFMPLWLWVMAPALTWAMERAWAKNTAYALLAMSVFSMSTVLENPWQHPWIYRFFAFLGWIEP